MPRALPRSLAFALTIWAAASAVTVAASASGAPAALVVGLAGGTLFGLASAGRVGGRRIRVRSNVRRRRSSSQAPSLPSPTDPAP